MIVSDRNVSDALTYLSDDPHPLARARHELTLAENKTKEAFAEAFLDAEGSVDARKSAAELSEIYVSAKSAEADAQLSFERHRSRVKAAEMIIEVWRSENANVRAAERVR